MFEIYNKALEISDAVKKKNLTIAMFVDTYPPDINGVAVAVDTLKKSLEAAGHTVYVVTPTEQTAFTGKIEVDENNVIRIPGLKLKKLYGYRIARPVSISAYKLLKSLNIDICHVHTEFSMRFIASAFCNGNKIPMVYTYHTMYEDYTHYVTKGHGDKIAKRIVSWLSYMYAHGVSAVIAPTDKTKDTLLSYGIENDIFVIPSGINTKQILRSNFKDEEISSLKNEYSLNGKFVLVYLGRIAKEKNVDFLINSMVKLKELSKDFKLLIVGYGPDYDRLRALTEKLELTDYVSFTGKVPHDKIGLYYALGNVFVSASTSETQGLTYMEAMAAGLPVIAKRDRCLDGVITDGENGYQFDAEEDFFEKLIGVSALNSDEYGKMSENALTVADGYSFENTSKKISDVYRLYIEQSIRLNNTETD